MGRVKTKHEIVAALESTLIDQLRVRNAISRTELARLLKLAPSTVSLYVDRLIADGFLFEGSKAKRSAGRPPTVLELNPDAGQFVGVDFEAERILAVAIDFAQQELRRRESAIAPGDDAPRVVKKIERTIAAASKGEQPLLGIGVAVPGVVDRRHGIARRYRYIEGWQDVPLVQQLSQRFSVPACLENNVRGMAAAELRLGRAVACDNFLCLAIRSGIGAAVVINRKLYSGTANLAGEIGGWICDGGTKTSEALVLEDVASGKSILANVRAAIDGGRDSSLAQLDRPAKIADVVAAARNGDVLVIDVLTAAARAIGRFIGQANRLLNAEKVILCGPFAELGELFLDPLREACQELTAPPFSEMPSIEASDLGPFSGAMGVASLAVHRWRPQRK